jgi:hypothetical protein
MGKMKACKHFSQKYGDYTCIIQADVLPWNAWEEVYENGKLIYRSLETGLFDKYLRHLLSSPECRDEVGVCIFEVENMLAKIEKEWKAITSDDC